MWTGDTPFGLGRAMVDLLRWRLGEYDIGILKEQGERGTTWKRSVDFRLPPFGDIEFPIRAMLMITSKLTFS